MDHVISRLSEIEKAAVSIMDETGVRKKAFAAEMEKKTAEFDAALEQETARKLEEIQKKMEKEMEDMLAKQTADSGRVLRQLEADYEERHEAYVRKLFQSMIKE